MKMEAQWYDPHGKCQECYYFYTPALYRVLRAELPRAIWFSDQPHISPYSLQLHRAGASRQREGVPSLRELCWRRAMMTPAFPISPPEEFPSLAYLAKLSLWEHLRKNRSSVSDYGVRTLPIPPQVQQDLVKFITDEEISMKKHVCLKFRSTFCELFRLQNMENQ